MSETDAIFLSLEEATSAIAFDFSHYPLQPRLLLDLCPLILGDDAVIVSDHRQEGIWMSTPGRRSVRKMKKLKFWELSDLLLKTLVRSPPEPEMLAAICSRVFLTPVRVEHPGNGGKPGVRIETGMALFTCRQCGQCCRQLDYHHELSETDYQTWVSLGRGDILRWVGVMNPNGTGRSYGIWIKPGTREYVPVCPWLKPVSPAAGQSAYECRIHEVKPEICRQYPGTRKHAQMTGCPAFLH